MGGSLVTAEELLELGEDHTRHELVRGVLTTMPARAYLHGKVAMRVGGLVDAFVREHGLGDVFAAESGFTLARDPDTVRAPYVSFLATVAAKVLEWLDAGCRQVWVLYPKLRRVVVHLPDGVNRTLGEDDELDGGDVLPGFRVPVAELFS